jgi:glycosyltransferase involved in cell wall biosynthesis
VTVLWLAKSTWDPAIRREHALAELAVHHGHGAWFLERPRDVRAIRDSAAQWGRAFAGRMQTRQVAGVQVVSSAVVVPPHRGALAESVGTRLLARRLRDLMEIARPQAVVAQTPWQWPAVSDLRGTRRVLEVTDDWGALLPHRRERMAELQRRAAAEADAIVLVSADMAGAFPSARTVIVPNGVDRRVLDPPLRPPPRRRRMLYVGTLSPRVDLPLIGAVLARLPDWRLDLHGQSQYPGRGDDPGEELTALLDGHPDRAAWHGVTPRSELAAAIDAADVAIIPMRPSHTSGQDSMKLYDVAARGRPIVLTQQATAPPREAAALTAHTAEEFTTAVLAAYAEPSGAAAGRRAWAAANRWDARWRAWSAAVLGEEPKG